MEEETTEKKKSELVKIASFRQKMLTLLNDPRYKRAQKIVWVICIIWAGCIVVQSIPYYIYISEGKQAALLGKFAQSEDLFMLALNESKNDDLSDPRLANSLNNLGELYRKMGRYDKAEAIYVRLLEIVDKLPANKKQEKAVGLNSVAAFYRDKAEYSKADVLMQKAIAIWEEEVKKLKDPNYAALLTSQGKLYKEEGRYKQAEALYQKALAIREQAHGAEHAEVATVLLNISALRRKEGKYKEAEPFALRALQIDQKLLGTQHPDTSTDQNNLGGLMRELKRFPESEAYYLQALNTRMILLGKENPQTAKSLLGLGELRREQARFADAEKLLNEALSIDKRVYGTEEHPDCADCLNALALVYLAQKKNDLAQNAIESCLKVRRKCLPAEHPDLKDSEAKAVTLRAKK